MTGKCLGVKLKQVSCWELGDLRPMETVWELGAKRPKGGISK